MANTTQQVGGALGLAVLATLSASRTDQLTEGGVPVAQSLTTGFHLAFTVGAALAAAAALIAATVLRPVRTAVARDDLLEPAA